MGWIMESLWGRRGRVGNPQGRGSWQLGGRGGFRDDVSSIYCPWLLTVWSSDQQPRSWLEMQNLSPHPRSTESEAVL